MWPSLRQSRLFYADRSVLDLIRSQMLETVCIIAFTLEYTLRLLTCTERPVTPPQTGGFWSFFLKPMSLVDLVAIAPFWIELAFGGQISLGVLRMLRMTRIFRVLKVGNFADDLQLFTQGMSNAAEGLTLLFFMLVLYFCVFSTLLYMFEYEAQVDCRNCATCGCPAWRGFTSIPTSMYFVMATMTTVGYGDMYPITVGGKLACGCCMLCSIFALGLPIVVIGVAFQEAFKVRANSLCARLYGCVARSFTSRCACRTQTSSKLRRRLTRQPGRPAGRANQRTGSS